MSMGDDKEKMVCTRCGKPVKADDWTWNGKRYCVECIKNALKGKG